MARTKGSKNKSKVSKNLKKYKKLNCNGEIMKNLQDVLDAVAAQNTALDALIANLGNIKNVDLTPAVDAINAVTEKIKSTQLPA